MISTVSLTQGKRQERGGGGRREREKKGTHTHKKEEFIVVTISSYTEGLPLAPVRGHNTCSRVRERGLNIIVCEMVELGLYGTNKLKAEGV